jgi:hypothetical protein
MLTIFVNMSIIDIITIIVKLSNTDLSSAIELLQDKLPVVPESVSRYTNAEEFFLSLDCAVLKHPPASFHLSIVL